MDGHRLDTIVFNVMREWGVTILTGNRGMFACHLDLEQFVVAVGAGNGASVNHRFGGLLRQIVAAEMTVLPEGAGNQQGPDNKENKQGPQQKPCRTKQMLTMPL